jgi:hypothetical protein
MVTGPWPSICNDESADGRISRQLALAASIDNATTAAVFTMTFMIALVPS